MGIFNLKTSRSRMILLFLVDILTIVFDTYCALIIRFKLDNFYYGIVPEGYMASVNSYVLINVVTTLIIFLVAATGVSNVLVISGPLFTLIFPMSVVMTVLGVCKKFVPNDGAWKGAVYVASVISIYDAFVTARSSGLVSINTDALDSLIAMIPLSGYGFDWLIPTILGFIVGAVIWKALGKESKPDAALSST